ncbi:MAG: DNA topology modulation protein FlaR [Rhodobacterales bacterium]|nr:MAG: DNA topology modulation protein FlaR [Rhodobacterales bacterium]
MTDFQRIMVIGGAGSGKSTLARRIGAITGLPVIHIDPMYWNPGWVQKPGAETTALVLEAAARPDWVFEGNHSATMEARAARADLIVFLDLPRHVRVRRVIWRSLRHYGRSRPDMARGCPEQFDRDFIFGWVWRFEQTHRPAYLERMAAWSARGMRVAHLSRPRDVRRFERALRLEVTSSPR